MLIISKRQEDHLKSKAQNINETQKLGKIFKSKVAELSWNENYRIQWDKVEIIHKEGNRMTRKLEELVHIITGHQPTKPRPKLHIVPSAAR
jgi:hypothetical protein